MRQSSLSLWVGRTNLDSLLNLSESQFQCLWKENSIPSNPQVNLRRGQGPQTENQRYQGPHAPKQAVGHFCKTFRVIPKPICQRYPITPPLSSRFRRGSQRFTREAGRELWGVRQFLPARRGERASSSTTHLLQTKWERENQDIIRKPEAQRLVATSAYFTKGLKVCLWLSFLKAEGAQEGLQRKPGALHGGHHRDTQWKGTNLDLSW